MSVAFTFNYIVKLIGLAVIWWAYFLWQLTSICRKHEKCIILKSSFNPSQEHYVTDIFFSRSISEMKLRKFLGIIYFCIFFCRCAKQSHNFTHNFIIFWSTNKFSFDGKFLNSFFNRIARLLDKLQKMAIKWHT